MKKHTIIIICVFLAALLGSCAERPFHERTEATSTAVSTETPSAVTQENTGGALPENTGAYCVVNGNVPFFFESELTAEPYRRYSELDSLGRCGAATAVIGKETLPTEERGRIGMIKPSGWHTVRYDGIVEGNYLYNRCHLIGYQLSGENDNRCNLITGTRYLNVSGMLPFENLVSDYVTKTGNHVLYRVTPKFYKDDLLAEGVLMEARSVEDGGEGICFCVFCYNIQPGITIDYRTGDSKEYDGTPIAAAEETPSAPDDSSSAAAVTEESLPAAESLPEETAESSLTDENEQREYIVNIGTKRFHLPDCPSVEDIKEKNKRAYHGTKSELEESGYVPCGRCMP